MCVCPGRAAVDKHTAGFLDSVRSTWELRGGRAPLGDFHPALSRGLLSHFTPARHIPDYLRKGHVPPRAATAAAAAAAVVVAAVLVGQTIWQHGEKKNQKWRLLASKTSKDLNWI